VYQRDDDRENRHELGLERKTARREKAEKNMNEAFAGEAHEDKTVSETAESAYEEADTDYAPDGRRWSYCDVYSSNDNHRGQ
jgi:hypothetical protein